jgi:protein SCO1/2
MKPRMAVGSVERLLQIALLCCALALTAAPAYADDPGPDELLETARFEQKLNAQVPRDLSFHDERGRPVRLESYFGNRPVILALAYYNCPNLCNVVLKELATNLNQVNFTLGEDFDVVTVSIDPREGASIAREAKARMMQHYAHAGSATGWHALTGEQASIERLAATVGFRYAWDNRLKQYAHPSGLMILTPEGRVSKYLYGLVYSPRDLRLALVEASANKIGTLVDQVLLRCYQYNPVSGKYTMAIMQTTRLAGIVTVIMIGAFMVVMVRRERSHKV